ncbi:hypothetical protein LTS18_002322, partial [Coniosporium uncinatum]
MMDYPGEHGWSLNYWRNEFATSDPDAPKDATDWARIKYMFDTNNRYAKANPNERLRVERTVSAEVMLAYIEALINVVQLGVGTRGVRPTVVLQHIMSFKAYLERQGIDLGPAHWDGIIVRLLESEGFNIGRNPGLMLAVTQISQPFESSKDLATLDVESSAGKLSQDRLDSSAAVTGFMHQVLNAYINNGDIGGALTTFERLQVHADTNKKRSMESFFQSLRESPPDANAAAQTIFSSNLSGLEYPGIFPQIPIPILAGLLNLLTKSDAHDFGRWLLYSQDPDGPIISKGLYSDP